MIETWKELQGYEDRYRISDHGRIWSKQKFKCMGERISKTGYVNMSLRQKNSPAKQHTLHRLVAIAFIPNPENKPQVNHIDGDKQNNCVENLEWATCSENIKHAFKLGLRDSKGAKNSQSKLTKEDVLWMRENKGKVLQKDMAKRFGVSSKYVSDVICGIYWKHI